jgi:general secretion pathway protein L
MMAWPVLSWLKPQAAVRVVLPEGGQALYLGKKRPLAQMSSARRAPDFDAIQLPEDLLLRRQVKLPGLPPAEAQAALLLEAQSQSPFPAEELLWVALPGPGAAQELVLTSRALVQAHIDKVLPAVIGAAGAVPRPAPEVWVLQDGAPPVVLPGFGEARRERHGRVWWRIHMGLCVSALLLAAAAAITPTLQLRLRALDAVAQHTALQQQVAPLLKQREGLTRANEQLQALSEAAGAPVSALQVLDLVTRALPDDTALLTFALNATESPAKPPKVVLTGQTGNAAALMQQLGNQPGLRDVKAPTAAVKPLGAVKESFTIEATLDLAVLKP